MNRRIPIFVALSAGSLLGLSVGISLPRAQAGPSVQTLPGGGTVPTINSSVNTSDRAVAIRLAILENKVENLEGQVKQLKTRPVSIFYQPNTNNDPSVAPKARGWLVQKSP